MTEQPRLMKCACCNGKGGYRHATHLDPAEYCDLCYGMGKVTAQRNAAYTYHRVYRAAQTAKQSRRRSKDLYGF